MVFRKIMKKIFSYCVLVLFFCFILFLVYSTNKNSIQYLPSNNNIFTQWLVFHDWKIFISSWAPTNFKNTKSNLWILEKDGNFVEKFSLNKNIFFGEWITIFKNKIYFLTWKNQKWFIIDATNFKKIDEFDYQWEWWWITNNDKKIFMSNWTEIIKIYNEKFEKIDEIVVTENGKKIKNINELEYINGFLYANIWLSNTIIKININTWEVEKKFNLDYIKNTEIKTNPTAQELNWIAYNKEKNNIIITWKMWSKLYIFDLENFENIFNF